MRRQYIAKIAILMMLCLSITSLPSWSFIAQESTQIIVKLKAISEFLNTLQMKLNQIKMLAQLPQQLINQIQGMKELLMENFSEVRGILQQVESITHFTDDLEAMLKDRHPDWKSGMTMDEQSARHEKRDKQWKESTEAYLKALNLNAKEFEDDQKTRDSLMKALSSAEGQVQALQALGALMDHANSMIARDEQTLQGFMTVYMESERDEIDDREQVEKTIAEALNALTGLEKAGETFVPGFSY